MSLRPLNSLTADGLRRIFIFLLLIWVPLVVATTALVMGCRVLLKNDEVAEVERLFAHYLEHHVPAISMFGFDRQRISNDLGGL